METLELTKQRVAFIYDLYDNMQSIDEYKNVINGGAIWLDIHVDDFGEIWNSSFYDCDLTLLENEKAVFAGGRDFQATLLHLFKQGYTEVELYNDERDSTLKGSMIPINDDGSVAEITDDNYLQPNLFKGSISSSIVVLKNEHGHITHI